MKIITIIGARPQFIKAAPLSKIFNHSNEIQEILIHTGQHFDVNMSDVFFKELDIRAPKYHLNIHGGLHGQMTGRMLGPIEEILLYEKPRGVLVYGDTNTTLSGALAAAKLNIPIFHVEAGLRSFNREMPEEVNRILTDHMSKLLFCPTETAVHNLKKEGITKGVYHVGDIMYDAMLNAMHDIYQKNRIFKKFNDLPDKFALLTIHRAASTKNKASLNKILLYIQAFLNENNLKAIFPTHPRTFALFNNGNNFNTNIIPIEPISYLETQFLLSQATFVLTDSGGLQKEAYFHRIPCVTLRSETEWTETIENGWNRLWTEDSYKKQKTIEDFGSGNCSVKIMNVLKNFS